MESLLSFKVIIIAFFFVCIILVERLFPYAERAILSGRQLKNLSFWVLNSVLSPLIILPLALWGEAHHLFDRPPNPYWIIADLIILDVTLYWWHRATHEIPFLWRFHIVHHLDSQLDSTTAVRFHFGEVLISACVRLPVIMVFAVPFTSVVLFEICIMCASLFEHSNIKLPRFIERLVRPIVITPDVHWIHHHPPMKDTNTNYGTFFTIWDRLFGSWNGKYRYDKMPLGVEGRTEKSFMRLMMTPFKKKI